MIICYLDDSGTHNNAEVIVSGGFVAPAEGWKIYEREALQFYKRHNVSEFHATKFKRSDGDFRGWTAARQMSFVQSMIDAALMANAVGVTVGLDKQLLAGSKRRHQFLHQTSAYGQSFKSVIDRLAADEEVGALLRRRGLAVVVEGGNANDENLRAEFDKLKKLPTFNFLESFATTQKRSEAAIQLADFIWPRYDRGEQGKPIMDCFLKMMKESVRTIGNYVEDISPLPDGGIPTAGVLP